MDPASASSADLKREGLTDAREGMQRIQSIVSDLKIFAYQKPGEDVQRVFLLEKAIQSALRLTSFDLKNVTVELALPQDTHVLGDEPAIIGVLVNLLSNAALALSTAARGAQPLISRFAASAAGRTPLARGARQRHRHRAGKHQHACSSRFSPPATSAPAWAWA